MPADILERKLLFVTGKGGVGKTTVASSLALLAASRGKRTLLCEIDAKGALADYCSARGQPHATFTDFYDVTSHLVAWLTTADLAPATAPRMFARAQELPVLET